MSDSTAGGAREVNGTPPGRTLYWLLALVVAVLVLGGGLAYGPEALRRPILTPMGIGILIGAAGGWLLRGEFTRSRLAIHGVIGLSAIAATGLMHWEIFHQIERAAQERIPGRSPIPWTEPMLDELDAPESFRRELRLGEQPTFRDYLAHRAAALFGETGPPRPVLLLLGELALAGVAGIAVFRRVCVPL